MSLPSDIVLPLPGDKKKDEDADNYLKDLIFELQGMYEMIANNVNGNIRNNVEVDGSEWIPIMKGTTSSGTFTYTNQTGWSLRRGIITDVWGDVSWNATTATGNLYVELPYLVAKSDNMPFVGTCQTSGFAYTAGTYLTLNAIASTFRGEFWTCGNGLTTGNQSIFSSGRVIFHIRYIGQSDD